MSTETELAWAAGFFDGDGSTTLSRSNSLNSNGSAVYLHRQLEMKISQVESYVGQCPTVLTRFQQAVGGLGSIRQKTTLTQTGNTVWHYSLTGVNNIKQVLGLLWPYLDIVKREQASNHLVEWEWYKAVTPTGAPRYPDDLVSSILSDYNSGQFTQKFLASKYGVSTAYVSRLVNNKESWQLAEQKG